MFLRNYSKKLDQLINEFEIKDLEIEIDPQHIDSFSLESFILKSLIDDGVEKELYYFHSRPNSLNQFNLFYKDLPHSLRNHPFFENHVGNFLITVRLKEDILVNPRSSPTSKDKYRYQVIPRIPENPELYLFQSPPDKKDLKANSYVLVHDKNIRWTFYYVNKQKTMIEIDFFLFPITSLNPSVNEIKEIKIALENQFDIPVLGKTEKTEVYETSVELAPDEKDNRFVKIKNKQYAVKKKKLKDDKQLQEQTLLQDRELNVLAGYSQKPAIYSLDEKSFFSVMEILPGTTLRDSLATTKDNTDTLIELSLEALYELENKHSLGIIHGDIKSENFLRDGNHLRLMDFDLSKKRNDTREQFTGSPIYTAPEILNLKKGISIPSDLFSIGLVLMEMWDCVWFREQENFEKNRDYNGFYRLRKHPFKVIFYVHDFSNTDLSKKHKNLLQQLIENLTRFNAQERGFLSPAISTLELIQLERKLLKLNHQNVSGHINAAYNSAKEARRKLTNPKNQNLETIRKIIVKQLKKITDHPEGIQQFISTLRIKSLKNCKTKVEIENCLDNILNYFNSQRELLLNLRDAIRNYKNVNYDSIKSTTLKDFSDLSECADLAVDKNLRYQVTVDDIQLLNQKMEKDIKKLQSHPFLILFLKLASYPDNQLKHKLRILIDELLYYVEQQPNTSLSPNKEIFLKEVIELLISCNEKPSEEPFLDRFKLDLKIGIVKYISNTLLANLNTGDRVFSLERMQNIKDLLIQINSGNSTSQLHKDVENYLAHHIIGQPFNRTGFFSGSNLRAELSQVLKAYKPKLSENPKPN